MIVIYLSILAVSFYIIAKIVDRYFISSLDNISEYLKLSPSVAGATLLAIGTSAPELFTALFALFLVNANPAIGLGTIVGSAIFQILVVIGFASLVKTTYLDWKPVVRDTVFYLITIVLLLFVIRDSKITLSESSFLLFTYLIYLAILFLWTRYVKDKKSEDPIEIVEKRLKQNGFVILGKKIFRIITYPIDILFSFIPNCEKKKKYTIFVFFISLVIIASASFFLVDSAQKIALIIGISPTIIALTILAGGSSIPELVSSYIISKQGRGDMAISNAIGSNTFDILVSLGLPVFIYNITKGDLDNLDSKNITSSVVLLLVTLVMILSILIAQKFKIGKIFGMFLIIMYVVYICAAYSGII